MEAIKKYLKIEDSVRPAKVAGFTHLESAKIWVGYNFVSATSC